MADGFHIASAYVTVTPDLDGFGEKLKSKLEAELADANAKVKVELDDGALTASLDKDTEKVRALGDETARPKADLDDGDLNAAVDEDIAKLRVLGDETARPKVDSSDVQKGSKDVEDAGGWMGLLITAAAAVAPVAITAGVGLAAFGGAAIPTLQRATTGAGQLVQGVGNLRIGYDNLAAAVQPEVIRDGNDALAQAVRIMPEFTGVARAGGNALDGFISQFGRFMTGGPARQFLAFVENQAGPDLHAFGTLLDGAASGVFGLTQALNPLAKILVGDVGGLLSFVGDIARGAPLLTQFAVGGALAALALSKLAGAWKAFAETSIASTFSEAIPEIWAFLGLLGSVTSAEDALTLATIALDAVSPWVWAGAAVAGFVALAVAGERSAASTDNLTSALSRQDDAAGYNVAGYQKLAAQTDLTAASGARLARQVQATGGAEQVARFGSEAYSQATAAVNRAHTAAAASALNLTTNLGQLERTFGLTQAQAIGLARAAGVSGNALSAGGAKAQAAMGKIDRYAAAGAQASDITTQMATDWSVAATQADNLTTRVTALTSAYNAMITPLTSVIGDTVTWKNDNVSLAAALKKSGDTTGYATANQRTASQAMATSVNDTVNLSEATLQNTGSAAKAKLVLEDEIKVLERLGAKGSVAAELLARLRTALAALHSKTVDVNVDVNGGTAAIPDRRLVAGAYASGGVAPGYAPGHDSMLARVSPGEGFIVPEAVQGLGGEPAIRAINEKYAGARIGRTPVRPGHFADGGIAARASFGFPQDVFNISVATDPGATRTVLDRLGTPEHTKGETATERADRAKAALDRVKTFEDAGKKLAEAFARGSSDTLAKIKDEARSAIEEIRKYYSGEAQTRLVTAIRRQTNALEALASQSAKISTRIATEKSYASTVTSGLESYADLSSFGGPIGGTPAAAGRLLATQLAGKLANLKTFFELIGKLKDAKVDKTLVAQVIALGPDEGIEYAQAILAGGSKLIGELNTDEAGITSEDKKIGQRATEVQYGQSITQGFLTGLRARRAEIDAEMRRMGDKIARELARDFGVPVRDITDLHGGGHRHHRHDKDERREVHITINYTGTLHPTAEQKASMMRELALAVG